MNYKLIRTFISIPLPETIRNLQKSLQSAFSNNSGKIKWVHKDHMHLTLKFLGDTPESVLNDVRVVLDKIAKRTNPIYLQIKGTGCFPKKERPRILWAGIGGETHHLDTLVYEIQLELDGLGFFMDEKPYQPHVTLGRARYPQNKTPNVLEFLSTSYTPIDFTSDKIQFISSELFPNGPVYTILSTHFFNNNSI